MQIKVGIVEDESAAFLNIKALLSRYEKEIGAPEVVFSVQGFSSGEAFLASDDFFDLVFMDIQMGGIDGIETALEMRKKGNKAVLIFVTDSPQYALRGYEADAFDYIVKPIVYEHLKQKLDKIVEHQILRLRRNQTKIMIRTEDEIIALTPSVITYVEIMGHHLIYHTIDKNYNAYGSLTDVEKTLKNGNFARCNHCYLVNLEHVTSISHNQVRLGEQSLQMSRPKRKDFLEAFTGYLRKWS